MRPQSPLDRGVRFAVEYHLHGTGAAVRQLADLLCVDQTVEAPKGMLTPAVRRRVLGRVERLVAVGARRHAALISFPLDLLDGSCAQLLSVVFGIASLQPGIRVARVHLPETALVDFAGPRFGCAGLRRQLGVPDRPLVCGVLKPLGRSPAELARLAARFALGGVDLVKDDQSLVDQPYCPFEERVARCAEAVAEASRRTGRSCLYVPHVSGPWGRMQARARRAKQAGAGGLLVCPGLTGYDALRDLARDDSLALPILSHPNLLGSYCIRPESGIAPAVLFGQLPRLAGADASIYPRFGLRCSIGRRDCRAITAACRDPWGPLAPIFPTAAGRLAAAQVPEQCELYGNDVLFIVGSRVQTEPGGVVRACERFMREVARASA
jgi:ribulose-bisphosphate carboxylase large chain